MLIHGKYLNVVNFSKNSWDIKKNNSIVEIQIYLMINNGFLRAIKTIKSIKNHWSYKKWKSWTCASDITKKYKLKHSVTYLEETYYYLLLLLLLDLCASSKRDSMHPHAITCKNINEYITLLIMHSWSVIGFSKIKCNVTLTSHLLKVKMKCIENLSTLQLIIYFIKIIKLNSIFRHC